MIPLVTSRRSMGGVARRLTISFLSDTGGLRTASPLNNALAWCVVSGLHPRRDRVGAYDGQGEGGATTQADSRGFTALRSPGWGGSGWYWPATGIALGASYTLALRLRLDPLEDSEQEFSFPKLLSIPYRAEASWLIPFGWHLALLPLTVGATLGRLRLISPRNASERNRADSPDGFVLLDGAEHTYTVRVQSNGNVDWWRDGVPISTTAWMDFTHAAPDLGDAPHLIAFAEHRQILEEGLRGTMPAAAIWATALSDAQIAAFHSDPWDLVERSADPEVPATLHAWDDHVTLPAGDTSAVAVLANDSGTGRFVDSVTQPGGTHAGTSVAIVDAGAGIEVTIDDAETAEEFEFSYTAKAPGDQESTATVHVAVHVPPQLGADNAYTLGPDETYTISPLENDNAPDGSTIQSLQDLTGAVSGTSIAINADGVRVDVTVAAAQASTPFSFSYTATGPNVSPWTQTVSITVTAAPLPVGHDDEFTLLPGMTHTVSPLANDDAPSGATIASVQGLTGAVSGTSVAVHPNGTQVNITIAMAQADSTFSFTYTGTAPGVSDWTNTVTVTVEEADEIPAGEDVNLPFFGRYYGNGCFAYQAGVANTTMNRRYTSFFFWGDRNARVTGFRWNIRHGPNYSAGTGGTYTVRVVEANPATKQALWPLVTISQLTGYTPAQEHGFSTSNSGSMNREKSFTSTGNIQAKKGYCLLFENTNNPGSNYIATNHDNQLNYVNNDGPSYAQPEEFFSPARIHLPGGAVRAWWPIPVGTRTSSIPGSVTFGRCGPPIMDIGYEDGIWSGWGNYSSGSNDTLTHLLTGNNQLRDRFRVTRASRVVDRLYVWPFRDRDISPSGNMVVALEQGPSSDSNGNGTTLATFTRAMNTIHRLTRSGRKRPVSNETANNANDMDIIHAVEFTISPAITLQQGQIYNLRFRTTGSELLYRMRNSAETFNFSPQESSWSAHEQNRRLSWVAGEDSRGFQTTSNGGSSWGSFHHRRIGYLFRCVI